MGQVLMQSRFGQITEADDSQKTGATVAELASSLKKAVTEDSTARIKQLEELVDQLAGQLDDAAEFIVSIGQHAPLGSEDRDLWIPVILEEIEEKLEDVEVTLGRLESEDY